MSCLISLPLGKWEWKVVCPEEKSTCPRQPDGTFFESGTLCIFSLVVMYTASTKYQTHHTRHQITDASQRNPRYIPISNKEEQIKI